MYLGSKPVVWLVNHSMLGALSEVPSDKLSALPKWMLFCGLCSRWCLAQILLCSQLTELLTLAVLVADCILPFLDRCLQIGDDERSHPSFILAGLLPNDGLH